MGHNCLIFYHSRIPCYVLMFANWDVLDNQLFLFFCLSADNLLEREILCQVSCLRKEFINKTFFWSETQLSLAENLSGGLDSHSVFNLGNPVGGGWVVNVRARKKLYNKYLFCSSQVKLAAESLRDIISFEKKIIKESSYSVSGILSSSDLGSTSRSENLEELLDENKQYVVYRFTLR